jgi:BlaI family transcriptional regulator, penicillinase repressor
MRNTQTRRPRSLGEAEQAVMNFVWAHGPVSAEGCRTGLKDTWPMKDSTIRTVLTRLERKRFVTHTVEGRAFLYRATERKTGVAARAVKHIIDRFCAGSAEELVMGLVDHDVLTPKQLDRLARTIALRKGQTS